VIRTTTTDYRCKKCDNASIVLRDGWCWRCAPSPDAPKPMIACAICATNVAVTQVGICAACYAPKAAAAPAPRKRPDWDTYFFEMARLVSTRATCPRASIGVVLVDAKNRVLSTGYNGAPRGELHCLEAGCTMFADHCVRATHAEVNAVEQHLYGTDGIGFLSGATAYVVGPRPICSHCAGSLYRAGVKEVKWKES
jgi:dCMP deaminase